MPTFLCIASAFKGDRLLVEAARLGVRVLLLVPTRCREENWSRPAVAELFHIPDFKVPGEVVRAATHLVRHEHIDCILPLDEGAVMVAAEVREHLRLPGLGTSQARLFRDKLAMRVRARAAGLCQPTFVSLFNDGDLDDFLKRVPAPWLLKPRMGAGAMGIRMLSDPLEVRSAVARLGDLRTDYLLEQYVAGDVFHVDSLVAEGEVRMAQCQRYDVPPLTLWNGGGVFVTRTVDPQDPVLASLLSLNRQVLQQLGLELGASHAEFIRCQRTGHVHFLEAAARVGGANLDVLFEHTAGVSLWREWVRVELARLLSRDYQSPPRLSLHGALLQCLARSEQPDMTELDEPEVVWRLERPHHAGLIVASPSYGRVQELADRYTVDLGCDFLAVLPPLQPA